MPEWNWDVRTTVKNGDAPDLQDVFDKINLMCFVLYETTFNDLLNGPIRDIVITLVDRIQVAPSELLSDEEKTVCVSHRDLIVQEITIHGLEAWKLRDLYQSESSSPIPQSLFDAFSAMREAVPILSVPFLELHQNGSLISKETIDQLLSKIGHLTEFDLYSVARGSVSDDVQEALKQAYDVGLLEEKDNDHIWNGVECIPEPLNYCGTTVSGEPVLACRVLS